MTLALAGCAAPRRAALPPPKIEGPSRTVHTEAGEATRRSSNGDRLREWEIRWDSASLEIAPDGSVGGSMEGVRGVLYRDDAPASDFSADRADADPDTGTLTLKGHVKAIARGDGASMTCETLEWRGRQNIVVAQGQVRIESKEWVVGPEPELWANGDFTTFGTPEWFQENNR